MNKQVEIAIIKRSGSWRNPDVARAESSAIIRNASDGPSRPTSPASRSSGSGQFTVNNQKLKVFFPSLNETFTLAPLFDPEGKMYWIEDEDEQLRWYAITGFPTCCMIKREHQMFCHSSWEVKIGEIING